MSKIGFSQIKTYGVVYTSRLITNLILDNLNYKHDICYKKIIDPACGDGAFLTDVLDRFIKDCFSKELSISDVKFLIEQNIVGFDIDEKALEQCKENMHSVSLYYGIDNVNFNLRCLNSLDKSVVSDYFHSFDFVVGNPPYVRIQNLSFRDKIRRDWKFCKIGSTDAYIAFFELGIMLMNDNGVLGYITPRSYFNTKNATALRKYIIENKLLKKIIDFGDIQLFENVTTYSAITILSKRQSQRVAVYKYQKDTIEHIDDLDISNFNRDIFIIAENSVLKKIKEIETRGVPLGKIAKIHVGIATLADDIYIFKNVKIEDDIAFIKLKDGREFCIESKILRNIVKVSVMQSENAEQNRYIIFPYKQVINEKGDTKHVIIEEDELKNMYPLTYNYFVSVKDRLLKRDRGKLREKIWYAFGRSQGLDNTWGRKILFAPLSKEPCFILHEKEDCTFYSGYCIKSDVVDLHLLLPQLNSDDMRFYIQHVSRDYQNGYKGYNKVLIEKFNIVL